MAETIHATLIAVFLGGGGWKGALLRGPSGAGKSDFALRALGAGWRLVADDRVVVWRSGAAVYGRAPRTLSGLIELRGQAVLSAQTVPFVPISLIARLAEPGERQPEPATQLLDGLEVSAVTIAPFEASGPARLRRIVEQNAARL